MPSIKPYLRDFYGISPSQFFFVGWLVAVALTAIGGSLATGVTVGTIVNTIGALLQKLMNDAENEARSRDSRKDKG